MSDCGILAVPVVLVARLGFVTKNTGSLTTDCPRLTDVDGLQSTPDSWATSTAVPLRNCFIRDLVLMLKGVQSGRFHWIAGESGAPHGELSGHFTYTIDLRDIIALGVSDDCIRGLIQSYIACGTMYRRLSWLARHMVLFTPTQRSAGCDWWGSTWASFVSALDLWLLNNYELVVQGHQDTCSEAASQRRPIGLLQLDRKLRPLMKRLE